MNTRRNASKVDREDQELLTQHYDYTKKRFQQRNSIMGKSKEFHQAEPTIPHIDFYKFDRRRKACGSPSDMQTWQGLIQRGRVLSKSMTHDIINDFGYNNQLADWKRLAPLATGAGHGQDLKLHHTRGALPRHSASKEMAKFLDVAWQTQARTACAFAGK